jgi:Flp pilus assembly protein TadD
VSYVSLSDSMERIGQSEKAVAFAREGIRIDPNYATIYMNLVESLVSLGRNEEAKETCKLAFERNLDGTYFHLFPLMISFIENDQTASQDNLRWFAGRDDEHLAFDVQARAASVKGQWRTAQDFSRRSVDLASHTNALEVAGKYAAEQAVRIVFWSSGTGLPEKNDATLRSVLKAQTNKALSLEKGQMVVVTIALALAVAGQSDEAARLLDELFADRPNDTLLKHLWAPTIKAALWLQSGKLKEAVEELEITERLEKAGEFIPQYLRGLALLKLSRNQAAAREFDKILSNRGEAPLSSLYPLAQLGKARALKDKAEYEKFLEIWKDADKDMPALAAARAEFEALG